MAPSLRLRIDSKKVERALKRAPKEFKKEVRLQMKKEMRDIIEVARREHRYNRPPRGGRKPSGNLRRSTKHTVRKSGFLGLGFIDDSVAPYGKFIHEGFKSWKPDRFLYNAFNKGKKKLEKNMRAAIMRGFKKAGLK